jgi:hypothetical protein
MVKLTKQPLASLKPRAKPYIEYDTELLASARRSIRLALSHGYVSTDRTVEDAALRKNA